MEFRIDPSCAEPNYLHARATAYCYQMNRYFSSYVPAYNANVTKVKTVTFWLQPMLCHHVHLQSSFRRIVFASHCLCSLQMVEWAGH